MLRGRHPARQLRGDLTPNRVLSTPRFGEARGDTGITNDVNTVKFHLLLFFLSRGRNITTVGLERQMANVEETTALITGAHVDHVRRKDYLITRNEALQSSENSGVDVDEAWCRFEIARRSAEFYMDKYFQHLEARSSRLETTPNTYLGIDSFAAVGFDSALAVDASDVVESRGEHLHNSKYWNMKAARDCLIKDLNNMSFWIQQLALSRQPEVRTPMGVACFSGVAITGLQHVRSEPLQALLGVGKGAALLTLVSSLAYLLHLLGRREAYSHYQKSIAQCLDAAYGWTLTDFHQRTVYKYQYQLLRRLT